MSTPALSRPELFRPPLEYPRLVYDQILPLVDWINEFRELRQSIVGLLMHDHANLDV